MSGGEGAQAGEAETLRETRQSLEAVDTALQAMLSDLRTLSHEYARAAEATAAWADIMGCSAPAKAAPAKRGRPAKEVKR
jgi:hypothetical protein